MPILEKPKIAEGQDRLHRQLGALSGSLLGLGLAAGLWAPDLLNLGQAHEPLVYPLLLLGLLALVLLGALAGWLAARTSSTLLSALVWLVGMLLMMAVAGHLPFEGRTLLGWLADRRFWGLPLYPFDSSAQSRLLVASFFPTLVLVALGLLQDYRLEGVRSAMTAQRLGGRSWLLLLLPLPLVAAAGLAADGVLNSPLRNPLLDVAQVIRGATGYSGDLDVLTRQTGINYSAVHSVRDELTPNYRLSLGEIDLSEEQTVVVLASFDNGAWVTCRVLVDQVTFCQDGQAPYTQGLQWLLAGHDLSQCADCQIQAGADWQAWLADKGRFTGAAQITRVAASGSYVIMRAANPASGYAIQCLFQGNRAISLVRCDEAR